MVICFAMGMDQGEGGGACTCEGRESMVLFEGLLAEARKYGMDFYLVVSWCNLCQMQ